MLLQLHSNEKGSVTLAIRLLPSVENRLNALAKTTGRTKTFYARKLSLRIWATLKICIWQIVGLKRFMQVKQRQRLVRSYGKN